MNKRLFSFLETRCLIFTDLHIGVRKDSDIWHKIALDYGIWLKEQALKNNINTLIFMGDFYHNREEISLTTLDTGNKFLEALSDFNIIMLVGNHDCYFRDNANVHSLAGYNNWKNICIVDKTEVLEYMDKKIAFIPWGFNYDEIPEGIDYAFGHFEINSFKQNKMHICESTLTSSMLMKKIKNTYSGHFHLRGAREIDGRMISYIGNTFQQNWGESDEVKGIEIIDFSTGKTEFIENTISPKHVKIDLSKVLSKDEEEVNKIKNESKGNIVKIIVDNQVDSSKVDILMERLSKLGPIELNSEIVENVQVKSADEFESVEIDLKLLLQEYINQLEINKDKDKILQETLNIYDKAVSMVKSE